MKRRDDHAKSQAHAKAVWTLFVSREALHLMRGRRTTDGCEIDRVQTVALASADEPNWAEAMRRFDAPPADEALTVCLDDEWVLYRRLTLPRTDTLTLSRMVPAQAEAVLPCLEELAWTWARLPDTGGEAQHVLLAAVRRSAIEPIVAAAQTLGSVQRILPGAFALARGITAAMPSHGAQIVIAAAAHHATVLVIENEQPLACRVVMDSMDDPRHLARIVHENIQQTGTSPQQVHLATHEMSAAGIALLQAHLQMPVAPLAVHEKLVPPPSLAMYEWLMGAGAALHEWEGDKEVTLLSPRGQTAPVTHHRLARIRLALYATWLVTVLAGWYLHDLRYAEQLSAAVTQQQQLADPDHDAARITALASWLDRRPTLPLALLDELSAVVPESLIVSALDFGTDGHLRLAGQVQNVTDLDKLLNALADSPLFMEVELRRTNPARDKWTFELSSRAAPLPHLFARPSRPTEDDGSEP